ncbi:DUF3102 domain-containing protein (plasmid) [Leptospira interrogans]|uniref:DUF3102 domain-containing protein n=1 Tax=Leptospira interrogans TaxID=173 RepID=UPI0002BE791C|nr:DUF3102 domain-containing protein [Leptospira interrogans]EMN60309.1 PF11300 domain protein [Leptospira interrogans serovar Pyrogenes str. R168]ULG90715.1 DUF3102 domain-containing protein [Leptospira interrogans]UML78441.1 DUF3102 domain-containing protein [Leptospira interrogans]
MIDSEEEKKRKAIQKQYANIGPRPGTIIKKKQIVPKDTDTLASEILILYKGILTNLSNSVKNAIEIGERLNRRKLELEYGLFSEWVDKTFPFSLRTAQRWMEVSLSYANKEFIVTEDTDLNDIYEMLKEKKRLAREKLITENKVTYNYKELRIRNKKRIPLSKTESKALLSYLTEAQSLIKTKAEKKIAQFQKEIDLLK